MISASGASRRRNSRDVPVESINPAETVIGGSVPDHLLAQVRNFQRSSVAENTIRAYASDWRAFAEWCSANHLVALPAEPITVASYLARSANLVDSAGDQYYAAGTIGRWLAAINWAHEVAGQTKPGSDREVARTLQGIRRERGRPLDQKAPLLIDELRAALKAIERNAHPSGVIGHRDTGLLVFGFAGAFRRSELASLAVSDITRHHEDGLYVMVRKSKTDQLSRGMRKALPYGTDPITCPPCAFVRWIRVLHSTTEGEEQLRKTLSQSNVVVHVCRDALPEISKFGPTEPIFRPITYTGRPMNRPINGTVVNDVVKRRVAAIGLNSDIYGAHSLRAGFVTQAMRSGSSHNAIMRQTGHKNPATVEIYAREKNPLMNNAVANVGL